jgi:hypothetical protein
MAESTRRAMKANGLVIWLKRSLVLGLMFLAFAGLYPAQGAYHQVGDVVTNFTLYARQSWTNSLGFGEDAPMRLSDFSGKVIFVEFFDPT